MVLPPLDFESSASAISPLRQQRKEILTFPVKSDKEKIFSPGKEGSTAGYQKNAFNSFLNSNISPARKKDPAAQTMPSFSKASRPASANACGIVAAENVQFLIRACSANFSGGMLRSLENETNQQCRTGTVILRKNPGTSLSEHIPKIRKTGLPPKSSFNESFNTKAASGLWAPSTIVTGLREITWSRPGQDTEANPLFTAD